MKKVVNNIVLLCILFFFAHFFLSGKVFADYTPAINTDCYTVQDTSYTNCTDSVLSLDDGNTIGIVTGGDGGGAIAFHGWDFGLPVAEM